MNENLPQKYKENFFRRFFLKLKSFFTRKDNKKDKTESQYDYGTTEHRSQNNMLEELKVDTTTLYDTDFKKKEFMKNLTENPDLLENFSNERLEIILKYYLDENEEKRAMLKRINA